MKKDLMEILACPVCKGELELTVREPYRTTADLARPEGWLALLREISVLRITERRRDYYYAALAAPADPVPGGELRDLGPRRALHPAPPARPPTDLDRGRWPPARPCAPRVGCSAPGTRGA